MLTFDDGYQSFYTRVFPILQAFQWPAGMGPRRQLGRYASG
ncbi:polysaccharide deacetylase family protein [Escherichia coli]